MKDTAINAKQQNGAKIVKLSEVVQKIPEV